MEIMLYFVNRYRGDSVETVAEAETVKQAEAVQRAFQETDGDSDYYIETRYVPKGTRETFWNRDGRGGR